MEYIDVGSGIKSWCSDIEDGALEQAVNLAFLPFLHKHVAIMPDCHQGYGMPIGGVIATKGVIIPNAVGVDIGCGMCAVKVLDYIPDVDVIKNILGKIRERIPVGFKKHSEKQSLDILPDHDNPDNSMPVIHQHIENAAQSMGTLGGGNHFIELQKDKENNLWVMIHSGSRNVGKQVCDFYNKIAKKLNNEWYSSINPKWDLAFLPFADIITEHYILEMNWCVEFALRNRKAMMNIILDILCEAVGTIQENDIINIAHNYATMENHFGVNVMVHRKGATLAREGTVGIIPGSQGTASYIVEGLGNPDSFNSCSHGAGRVMGRKQAQRELDLDTEKERLDKKGILHSIRGVKDLDEAAGAYKDIDAVMEAQKDLVSITTKLEPIAVVKG
jgi:tRNA-splicing ligase RtcB